MSAQKITLSDVAKVAQLSVSGVSMAMRNDSSIPLETRQRVQAIAKKMGYRPNPMIAALNNARLSKRNQSKKSTIAYISYHPELNQLEAHHFLKRCYEGAKKRADALGFGLELFCTKEYKRNSKRLSEILYNRGIVGVLFALRPAETEQFHVEWNHFSVVTIGFRGSSQIDRVAVNNFTRIWSSLDRLKRLSYRKIGLVAGTMRNEFNSRHLTASYLQYHQENPQLKQLPVLFYPTFSNELAEDWMKANQPDAVIVSEEGFVNWICKSGIKIPEELGIVNCSDDDPDSSFSGPVFNAEALGEAGISLISQKLISNERGLSPNRKMIIIDSEWKEGSSLRPVND